jgi:hypothetical protein
MMQVSWRHSMCTLKSTVPCSRSAHQTTRAADGSSSGGGVKQHSARSPGRKPLSCRSHLAAGGANGACRAVAARRRPGKGPVVGCPRQICTPCRRTRRGCGRQVSVGLKQAASFFCICLASACHDSLADAKQYAHAPGTHEPVAAFHVPRALHSICGAPLGPGMNPSAQALLHTLPAGRPTQLPGQGLLPGAAPGSARLQARTQPPVTELQQPVAPSAARLQVVVGAPDAAEGA